MNQKEQATQQEQHQRKELAERIARAVPADGVTEPLPGLRLARASTSRQKMFGVLDPTFCVIAQGSKKIYLGGNPYTYDPYNYLLATAELPVVGWVLEASERHPYFGAATPSRRRGCRSSHGGNGSTSASEESEGGQGRRSQPDGFIFARRDCKTRQVARFPHRGPSSPTSHHARDRLPASGWRTGPPVTSDDGAWRAYLSDRQSHREDLP